MKFFVYLHYIFQGWLNYFLDLISDIKYKKIFDQRLEICNACDKNFHGICKECHCILKAKTKSEDSECPLKKWTTVKQTLSKD